MVCVISERGWICLLRKWKENTRMTLTSKSQKGAIGTRKRSGI
jgi:hypothetical protein